MDRDEIVRVLKAFEAARLDYVLIGATAMAARISSPSVLVAPTSAMRLIPSVARPPSRQNVTLDVCVAPIGGEKCGFGGASCGCVADVHVASNTIR